MAQKPTPLAPWLEAPAHPHSVQELWPREREKLTGVEGLLLQEPPGRLQTGDLVRRSPLVHLSLPSLRAPCPESCSPAVLPASDRGVRPDRRARRGPALTWPGPRAQSCWGWGSRVSGKGRSGGGPGSPGRLGRPPADSFVFPWQFACDTSSSRDASWGGGGRRRAGLERDRLWPRRVGAGAWHSCGVGAVLTPRPLGSLASALQISWPGEQMSCWSDSPSRAPPGPPLLPEAQQGRRQAERWPASCWLPRALAPALLCVCQAAGATQGAAPCCLCLGAGVCGEGRSGCW